MCLNAIASVRTFTNNGVMRVVFVAIATAEGGDRDEQQEEEKEVVWWRAFVCIIAGTQRAASVLARRPC